MVFACWRCYSVQYLFLCEFVTEFPCVRVCCRWLCPCLCLCSAFAVQRLMSVWVWELSVTSLIVGTEKVLVPLNCAQRSTVVCFEWTLAKECGVGPVTRPLHNQLIACPVISECDSPWEGVTVTIGAYGRGQSDQEWTQEWHTCAKGMTCTSVCVQWGHTPCAAFREASFTGSHLCGV